MITLRKRKLLMQRLLQFVAAALVTVALLMWLNTGANRGWTKTSVDVKIIDEVTGIEGHQYQKAFVPGVDFLGAAFAGAMALAGISLLLTTKTSTKLNP